MCEHTCATCAFRLPGPGKRSCACHPALAKGPDESCDQWESREDRMRLDRPVLTREAT